MKCPHCPDTHLVMTDRQGVEIDYCPICRGIWLDRGELDKLLDRAMAAVPAPVVHTPPSAPMPTQPPVYGDRYQGDRGAYKRPKSWLHDIFD